MIESNQFYNADCLDVMRQMLDKSVDLVLTDPPYGIGADLNAHKNGIKCRKNGFREYKKTDWDSFTPTKEYFNEIFRISKNQIIWGGNYFQTKIQKDSMCWLFWDKGQRNFSFADGELAWTSFDSAVRAFSLSRGTFLQENRFHATQKPVKLFEWCLFNYSKENDLILDCFSGSGTTAIACHNLKRNFICIEKDKEYFDKSVIRYNNHISQLRLAI